MTTNQATPGMLQALKRTAPDMLAVLKEAVDYAGEPETSRESEASWIQVARAVIAKATGKDQ